MTAAARQASIGREWFAPNVVSIFRPLWRIEGAAHYLLVGTPHGPVFAFVEEVRPCVFGWQIEFNENQLGDYLEGSLRQAMALVELGVTDLIHSRGGVWSR